MKANPLSKLLAMLLAVVMLVSVMPMSAFASIDFNADASKDDYYKLISKKDWELAPGIEETEIVLNNEEGSKRQVVHSVKVDMNNPYTKVIPGYKGMIPTEGNYGTESTSTQAKNAEALGYGNVVAATNAMLSWYDSAYYKANPHLIGEPLYYNILNGYYYENSQGSSTFSSANAVVVINYDYHPVTGEPRPDDMPKVTMRPQTDPLTGWEENAIGVWAFLVKPDANGVPQNQYKNATIEASGEWEKYHQSGHESRTFVGITADGEIILSVSDGRQAPYSTGFSNYEMADYMIKMGCIYAANCDGGGSTTFVSERPGEELKVNCSLSDGGERPTTNTFLVISTASASGEFERATLSTEYDYYTPGASVTFNALGTDAVGTKVDVPADVEWAIKEEGMGTIENGVFTSNGTVGTVTAQMLYNGEIVGEHSITLAMPDALSFSQPVVTIPYGEKAQIPVKATLNGLYEIGLSPADVTITSDNAALGTVDGLHFVGAATAPEENSSALTVILNSDPSITASTTLKLGEASVVMWDFEDGQADIDEWNSIVLRDPGEAHRDFYHKLSLATKEDGQVHDGEYSMRLETNGLSSKDVHSKQYAYVRLGLKDQKITLENARSLGFWMYVPEDNIQCWVQGFYKYDTNGDGTPDTLAEVNLMNSENVYYNVDESGWHYLSMDLSDFEKVDLTYSEPFDADPSDGLAGDKDEFFLVLIFHKAINNILWATNGSINGPFTYYIDNITVDYSEVVDDRESPIFESVIVDNNGAKESVTKHDVVTLKDNVLNVVANVTEATYKVDGTGTKHTVCNYTGLNTASAKAYVDGVEVDCAYADGKISLANVAVADGYHRVKFEICDNAGNKSTVVRMVNVVSGVKASTIELVPADPALVKKDRLDFGSIFWMNLVASDIETIQSVETIIDLNSVNHWQLDNMILADGFSADYTIDDETNTATITFTRTGTVYRAGEAVLAQLPIRMIYFDTDMNIPGYTAQTVWTSYTFWPHDLKVDVDKGEITYVDGYESAVLNTFSNEKFQVNTEMYTDWQSMGSDPYYIEHGTTHVHIPVALADKAADCTDGYSGRTFCEVCNSVVEWGTTIPATTEHNYEIVDGKLTCTVDGELFNGTYMDGITYYDGVAAVNGWIEIDGIKTYYYKDGVKLTGSNFFDGAMYTFDENGVYLPDYKYDGFFETEAGLMYFVGNEYMIGAVRVLNDCYYFDKNGIAYDGEIMIGSTSCLFDNGLSVAKGTVVMAGICGEDAHFILTTDGVLNIIGEGDMTDYKNIGLIPWYNYTYRSTVKTVVIDKNITTIGQRAFINSPKLTKVVFEEGSRLKTIEIHSFGQCPALTSIEFPEGLETIKDAAFDKSPNLAYAYMPASVTTIGGTAFSACKDNLTMNVLEGTAAYNYAKYFNMNMIVRVGVVDSGSCGENLTWTLYSDNSLVISGTGAMDDYTYHRFGDTASPWSDYRNKVTKLVIEEGVQTIGAFAFYGYNKISTVEFAENSTLTKIGSGAFGYSSITNITIPASVNVIDSNAFYFCSSLANVAVEDGSNLSTIGAYAFRNCTSLKTVFIPDTVRSIGSAILYACGEQATMQVANGRYAHTYALNNGYAVEVRDAIPVVLYSGTCGVDVTWELYDDGNLVISGNGNMANYTYHKFGETAAPWAQYRDSITKITIGAGVESIGEFAFYSCAKLTTIEFVANGKLQTIDKGAFGYCGMTAVTIPASVRTVADYAFYFCPNLETFAFEEGSKLFTIGSYAFRNCPSLQSVYIPDSVKSIGSAILYACGDQVVLDVAKGLYGYTYATNNGYAYKLHEATPIVLYGGLCGDNLVWDLYNNGDLVISGTGTMNDYTYHKYGDTAAPWTLYRHLIKKIVIGSGVESIGDFAFYSCDVMTSVEFAENGALKSIGTGAFGYTGLKTVTIPAGVETIADNAFYFSSKLETVTVATGSKLAKIGHYAFRNCTALKSITIPAATSVGSAITYACGDQVIITRF